MEPIRVVVSGSGRMGRQVAAALAAESDLQPVCFVDALARGEACDGLPVYSALDACLDDAQPRVIIDFTNAAWTPKLAEAALARGIHLVVGTTGLPASFVQGLERSCRDRGVGAVVASNFAIGAVLMMQFARQAARHFESAEIIELHHDQKVDAPSGTARTTAELMLEARGRPFAHAPTEKETLPGTRGGQLGGIAIHSVRLPGLVAHQEVLLGSLGQTLTIRHDSTGRDSFMPGVLAATRAVVDLDHLVVGLDSLLGLS